jgi:Ser/Thr protein kinase RdoA (MazF antagonist)
VKLIVERCVGAPAEYEELKHKPGRRLTLRTSGPRGSAIVKLYRSDRAVSVAARLAALADGPAEPEIPKVLALEPGKRMLVLSHVSGAPLREAVLAGDEAACRRAGAAIAVWHEAWRGRRPPPLEPHRIEDELAALVDRAALAPPRIRDRVAAATPFLHEPWEAATVVHRDLYEEQVLLGDRVGLIDLDDVAIGPAELDVGNLLAHLDLLQLRAARDLASPRNAFLDGYEAAGALDSALLGRCRTLARLRLACIHAEPELAGAREEVALSSGSSATGRDHVTRASER